MEITKEKKFYKLFLVVLIVVLLSSCIFVGTVLAWLTDEDVFYTENIIDIGSVDFEIYSGTTRLTTVKHNATSSSAIIVNSTSSPLAIAGGSTIRNVDLTIRNTGTVSAIIRVTLSIYYIDDNGDRCPCILAASSTYDNHISISNSGWVNDFPDSVTTGYTYYNSQIEPYTLRTYDEANDSIVTQDITANAVPVITQILVPDSKIDQTYYIEVVQVDGVAYPGNIYQEDLDKTQTGIYEIPVTAYPFGHIEDIPASWDAWK